MFLVCHLILQGHVIKKLFYGWEPLMVSHDPAKIGGYRQYGSKDMMVLVFRVISQDYVTKGSSNLMCVSCSRQVINLPNLVSISTVVVGIC